MKSSFLEVIVSACPEGWRVGPVSAKSTFRDIPVQLRARGQSHRGHTWWSSRPVGAGFGSRLCEPWSEPSQEAVQPEGGVSGTAPEDEACALSPVDPLLLFQRLSVSHPLPVIRLLELSSHLARFGDLLRLCRSRQPARLPSGSFSGVPEAHAGVSGCGVAALRAGTTDTAHPCRQAVRTG